MAKDFIWGISTSSQQTEGNAGKDGGGKSIWDEFSNVKGKISDGSNPSIATDFYNRVEEDIEIINGLQIPNFRFSLSWPRIIPNGTGAVNQKGMDFYDRLVDTCLNKNIIPWITLYHWDLPLELHFKGGWTNRDCVAWFEEYASKCTRKLGDRVKNWMVLNEPMAFTGAGYFLGVHAPGKKGRSNFTSAAHHAALANSLGSHVIRNNVNDANIGTTFSQSWVTPFGKSKNDYDAAIRVNDLINLFFLLPAIGKSYPLKNLRFLDVIEKYIQPGDESKLKADLDFIGIQTYTREVIKHSWMVPFIKASMVSAIKRNVQATEMGWEVCPESIYHVLKNLSAIENLPPILITENGAAFKDVLSVDGSVNDQQRIDYIDQHINQVIKAKNEGINVNGYFVWSLTDNFEWAEGYRPRFGLVHIDYEKNLKRTIKKSGYWYSNRIKEI